MTTLTTTSVPASSPSTPSTSSYADRPAPPPIPFARLLKVEMRKMFDTRSGLWLMASVAILSVLASAAVVLWAPEEEVTYGSFAGAVGDSRDTPRVAVAATVEHDVGDAGCLRTLSDELADLAGLGGLVTIERPQVGFEGGCRGQRVALAVVHDLHEYVTGRAGDDQTGTLGGADDLLAKTGVATRAGVGLRLDAHGYLPAFPALRRTTSPA